MQHGGVPELLLALAYNGTTGRLTVEVVKGSHFRNLALNKAPDTYVKLCLVSSMGQEMARAKTSTRRGQPNPLFKETFVFQVKFLPFPLTNGCSGILWSSPYIAYLRGYFSPFQCNQEMLTVFPLQIRRVPIAHNLLS